MLVYLVAALEAFFYLCAVPVGLVVRIEGVRARVGVSLFDAVPVRRGSASGGGPGARRGWAVLRRLRFDDVELTGSVALGDAAATAVACGGLNALGRSLRGRTRRMRVAVKPDFSDRVHVELCGMLRARTGQIILAVLITVKGRIRLWKSIRSRAS